MPNQSLRQQMQAKLCLSRFASSESAFPSKLHSQYSFELSSCRGSSQLNPKRLDCRKADASSGPHWVNSVGCRPSPNPAVLNSLDRTRLRNQCADQDVACTERRMPNARSTFESVASSGFPSAESDRYNASRAIPVFRATSVIPLARATSPNAAANMRGSCSLAAASR